MKYYLDGGIRLYNGDCLEVMDKLIERGVKVDLILTDPPYGKIKGISNIKHGLSNKTNWDSRLNTEEMFVKMDRICREKATIALFSQEPYTNELISCKNMNIAFSYRCVWIKDHFANSLISKKAHVNYFEDICIFKKKFDSNYENELRGYFKSLFDFIDKPKSEIINNIGQAADHCFRHLSNQFRIPTEEVYNRLIDLYKINTMEGFLQYTDIVKINSKYLSIFNLEEGDKYRSNVLVFKKDYDGFHPTQKPVKLLEELIKTFTNEGDTVLDFTMGSGSTGVACRNLNRKFIGIELDEKYFDIAVNRIKGEFHSQKEAKNDVK